MRRQHQVKEKAPFKAPMCYVHNNSDREHWGRYLDRTVLRNLIYPVT